jgi:hypothetical protein
MAELDIRGFVTPEQQINFDKLAETLSAQSAAKVKAEETKATKKAALQKAFEGKFETKDYLTGTVHDPHITDRLFDAKEKVNQFIQENPNASVSDIELFANPIIRGVATDSEKLKELERQRKIGEAYVSKIPGADPVKFNEYFKKTALLSPDGTIPDDLSGLDMKKDYGTYVLNNAPIWNSGAIDNLIAKAGAGKSKERVYTKDAKGKVREAEIEIESPLRMKPVLDKLGQFTGKFEMPHVLYKDNDVIVEQDVIDESTGKPKLDAQGKKIKEPVKMLEIDDYEKVMQDQGANGYIRQKIRELDLDPDSTAGQNYGRKVAFDVVNASSKAKTRFSEITKQVEAKAPVIKTTVNVGGKTDGTEVRDLYTPAIERYEVLQGKKNEVADLIKQGKTDAEIANIVGIAESAVKASRQGRNKARMPLNMEDLDVEFVTSIVENVGKSRKYTNEDGKESNYTADNLAVEVNDKGNFEVFAILPGKKEVLLATIPKTSLNWKAQSGAKPRQELVKQEKGTTKKTTKSKDPLDPLGLF